MAKKRRNRLPKVGKHSSGQGRIVLNGRTYYLGLHGSLDANKRYTELVERWIANGRKPLDPTPTCVQTRKVREVLDDYVSYLDATKRYSKNGRSTSQRRCCTLALDEFAATCGNVLATKLSDVLLRQHRDALEGRDGLSRGGINRKMQHIRMALRWARERGMLTRDQWLGIAEIRPLSRFECGGRDTKRPKRAVSPEDVEKVAAVAPPVVARMLRVQFAVGMRPGEVCAMKWSDLLPEPVDVDGIMCRVYVVGAAKNQHHGKGPTTYALPPSIVALLGSPNLGHVFPSPVRNGHGYCPSAYRNAVAKACLRADVLHFGPHELRHSFLSRAAQRFGVLAASMAANHADTRVTSGYLHGSKLDGYRCVVGLAGEGGAS